jgi:hypothetical protein
MAHIAGDATDAAERHLHCSWLRDIFGDPFNSVAIGPAWLEWNKGTVNRLARTIYNDKEFALMPILGDALEDALCDDAAILQHCRSVGPHVRGCWVLDLILGKF